MAAPLTCNQQQVTATVTSQVCPADQEIIKIFIAFIKSIFPTIKNLAAATTRGVIDLQTLKNNLSRLYKVQSTFR